MPASNVGDYSKKEPSVHCPACNADLSEEGALTVCATEQGYWDAHIDPSNPSQLHYEKFMSDYTEDSNIPQCANCNEELHHLSY